ncbi:hypothetical protein [Desulfolutivibrio sulfoxidireducens]|uniref:hypothetical protein n=1 Tax=Desulfolutivibrio sulfoxidireducens TaxID=2773299 RepID=UPI00159E07AE|nr:hypothetical protein [Desulfolutivibrio sulfoxidireducens]QLA16495.1 hypothetical protein GD605_10370 [Desulfolutivibrio sulfoxidireducens]QLA19627.1 hypothetical protein GD604_07700 [Desulfolutivibrio sulfoxidireducens]
MRSVLMLLVLLAAVAAGSCDRSSPLAGKYEAIHGEGAQARTIVLELGEAGQGAWNADFESISFKWDARGTRVLLHTRAGGVIQAEVRGEELVVDLPGVGEVLFRRTVR